MKVAVVILNWNTKDLLEKFLHIVVNYSKGNGCDVVLADNASTDQSVEWVKANLPSVKIIQLDKNYGFTGGYNRALAQLDHEYFVLLNSDVEVTENWLNPLINFLENNESYAAVMPKILDYNKKNSFEYAGAAGGFIDCFGYPFCRGRIFNSIEVDINQYNEVKDIFWASGACFVVKSNLFFKVGGFDEAFFAHMEEIDLCWRFQNLGYKIACVPSSHIFHVGGGTLSKINPHKTYLNFRNNLLLLYKNLPKKEFSKIIIPRLILDTIAAVSFLFTSGFIEMKAVLKAYKDFISMKNNYVNFKKEDGLMTKSVKGKYNRSIIFDYYFRKKSKFNELCDI